MRYCSILALPCAVLRYSYPPPPHLRTHICACSWNQEKVFFQFPESICIIYNVIRLTDKALLQFFTYTSTRMLILTQSLWQNFPVWGVNISLFSCHLLDLVTVLPFFLLSWMYLTDNTRGGWNKQPRENDLKQLTTAFSFILIYWKYHVENAGNAISETLNLKFFWGSTLAWGAFGIRTPLPVGTPLKTHAMPFLKGYQIHFNKAVKKWWNVLALWFIYI